MGGLANSGVFLFESFRLDRRAGVLFRHEHSGAVVPIGIGSRALDVLGVLVERAGDLVSRDQIITAVWPATAVGDNNLNMQIAALRRVLDDGRPEGSCIQTVPGHGYRFVAPGTWGEASPVSISPSDNGAGRSIADAAEPSAEFAIDGSASPPIPGTPHRLRRAVVAAVAGALFLVGTVLAAVNRGSLSSWGNGALPRLSIVVLPFANLNNDPDQQYFPDGITEDLTTDLSRIANMFVISHNTAATYRDKPFDTKQIGRDLGVRYVLEGSVQRSGTRVRVNAQLINAETDADLWAERFDGDMGDLFALQNEITGRIAIALNLELVAAEAARPTDNPDALDYILRGRAIFLRSWTSEAYPEAIGLFERALALDPDSTEAKSSLAEALIGRVLNNMTNSKAADLARAEGLVGQALAASPRSPKAHYARAQLLRAQDRYGEAISEYETVIALSRNWAGAYASLGACKYYTGSIEEAIPLQERAIRLSPHDPGIGVWYWRIGAVHLLQSRIDEAIPWLEKGRGAMPAHPLHHSWLAAAYALKGESEQAAAELAEARKLSGDDRFSSIARLKAIGYFGVPKIRVLVEATYFRGLRLAGMPEE